MRTQKKVMHVHRLLFFSFYVEQLGYADFCAASSIVVESVPYTSVQAVFASGVFG